MPTQVQHIVADAGAFIRNAPFRDICENVYTVPEVIAESCDRATRRRLKMLPVDIKFKEPSGDSLLFVSDFAKKTGDYKSLSAVDIKVLALTYELEKQFKGTKHIRKEPPLKPEWGGGQKVVGAAGVFASKQYGEGEALPSNIIGNKGEDESDDEELFYDAPSSFDDDDNIDYDDDKERDEIEGTHSGDAEKHVEDTTMSEEAVESKDQDELESGEDEGIEEDDDDDDEGWITPANINDVKRSMGVETSHNEDKICVGCLTTDFAMQNCLLQMGLHVISIDGMLIKRAKSFVLRCFGCMRITKDTSKTFCPHCGNKTLRRLTTSIADDGSVKYWLSKNFTIRTRGTKYSLPRVQGGKHATNPVLFDDQPMPQQRPSKKALQNVDILSDDIIAGMSPFRVNDVTSRAAQLGITRQVQPQWAKRNPNENRRTGKKRKGKK